MTAILDILYRCSRLLREGGKLLEYCEACGKEVESKVVVRTETFTVYGEDISVDAEVKVCAECGEELFSEELDSGTLVRVYNEYRRRHKLLLPEELNYLAPRDEESYFLLH